MSVEERVKGIVAEQLSIGADEIKNESSFIDDLGPTLWIQSSWQWL